MAIHFQPPIYHNQLVEEIKVIGRKRPMVVFRSDNKLVLHQESLRNYTEQQLQNLVPSSSSPSLPQMSDDDLFLACKSRRIQSPSELKKWSDFLGDMQQHILEHAKQKDKNDNNKTEVDKTKE